MREFLKGVAAGCGIAATVYTALRVHEALADRRYWRDIDPYVGAFTGAAWAEASTPTYTGGNGHAYDIGQ